MKHFFILYLFVLPFYCFSQTDYSIERIPAELSDDVSAVVRLNETEITLHNYNSMTYSEKRVVTVFNKRALKVLRPYLGYDSFDNVKNYEAVLYDASGKVAKKFKKKDFVDVSASGGNLYTDDRVKYLDFTPTFYPFTLEFSYETKTSSTAHIPNFMPIRFSRVSVEQSRYTLLNEKQIPMQTRHLNLEAYDMTLEEAEDRHYYAVQNLKPLREEAMSPHVKEFLPMVLLIPKKFQLKNTVGDISSWKDFGLWQREKLLKGRDDLPEQTKLEVTNLVAGIKDPKEKAKAIYEYMQEKTRYISVQVGIGGWQPSLASEVDKLNYGDCKGLTNYTYALLKSQGIESYYTIVDSQPDGVDLDEEFVALQGDHVILSVPFEDEMVFLECTSQQAPFNFLGTHTDDRKVLMVTPDGGVMTRTHTYSAEDNKTTLDATVVFGADLKLSGVLNSVSSYLAYDKKYGLERKKSDEIELYYKRNWNHLNNLAVTIVALENNKEAVQFKESLVVETNGYTSKAGNRILMNPNIFSRFKEVPKQRGKRHLPFQIRRGFSYNDTIEITLPEGYTMASMFEPIELKTEFGTYKASVLDLGGSKVLYQRALVLKSGTFPKEKFNNYLAFCKAIVKRDKSKIVLNKKQ